MYVECVNAYYDHPFVEIPVHKLNKDRDVHSNVFVYDYSKHQPGKIVFHKPILKRGNII